MKKVFLAVFLLPCFLSAQATINGVTGQSIAGSISASVTGNVTGNVVGNVTGSASLNLPLTGGTLTGQLAVSNLGILFGASDTNPACSAGVYVVYSDISEGRLKKCENGTISDMDTTGGTANFSTLTGGTNSANSFIVGAGASMAPTSATAGIVSANHLNGTRLSSMNTGVLHVTTGTGAVVSSLITGADIATQEVNLNTHTTGILPSAKGGTGTAFFIVNNLTASRTFTFPDVSAAVLTTANPVQVVNGGTGLTSGTSGGLVYFNSATSFGSSAALTVGDPVIGNATVGASSGTRSGNTTRFVTTIDAQTPGRCVTISNDGNHVAHTAPCGGTGSVTQVGLSFSSGIITVSGSPVTTNGTLALNVAGTQGGIPYFNSPTSWTTSGALTANLPVIGGGSGAPTVGTIQGSTTKFATYAGAAPSANDCVKFDNNGNLTTAGAACGTVTSGVSVPNASATFTNATSVTVNHGWALATPEAITFVCRNNSNQPILPNSWTALTNSVTFNFALDSGRCSVNGGSGGTGSTGGGVVSVSWTGGIVTVANPTTTPALTISGTQGGIPYFTSASTWTSTNALTANAPILGGGSGAPIMGAKSGNTNIFATTSGTLTSGTCMQVDPGGSGNLVSTGVACGASGGSPGGSGTELQYRTGATSFGGLPNSSVSGNQILLGGPLVATGSVLGFNSALSAPSSSGTYLGINSTFGFAGDFVNIQRGSTNVFAISSAGAMRFGGNEGTLGQCLKSGGAGAIDTWGTCSTSTSPAATMYVNPSSGSNSNNCSIGAKCQTLSYVLSILPKTLDQNYTINLDNGTYAENVCIGDSVVALNQTCTTHIVGASYTITLVGNTTTPANVAFTGASGLYRFIVNGPVKVVMSGIQITGAGTANMLTVTDGASVTVDRCRFIGSSSGNGIWAYDRGIVQFQGDNTVTGYTGTGILLQNHSMGGQLTAGTITVTGPSSSGTSGSGIVATYNSRWATPFLASGSGNLTVTNNQTGIQAALSSVFQSLVSGTITISNGSVPGGCNISTLSGCSFAATSNDVSTWAVNNTTISFSNFSLGFLSTSMSYIEHYPSGARSFTGLSQNCLSQNIDPTVTNCTSGTNKQIFLF